MKTWEKYEKYLLSGEWHIHTTYTDGKNTIMEYCEYAERNGIPLIAFTEHVRKKLEYDFNDFLYEIEKAKEEYDVIILSGCEAKILPGGELDVEEWILKEVDYPILAVHSFPADVDVYMNSLKKSLENRYINAWAHPGLFLYKNNLKLSMDQIKDVFKIVKNNGILLEINSKYNLPPINFVKLGKEMGIKFVRGDDIHSLVDFSRRKNLYSYPISALND